VQWEARLYACGPEIADRIGAFDGVTGVHVGVAEPSVTSYKTAETELKKQAGESAFDGAGYRAAHSFERSGKKAKARRTSWRIC
jgi:hypothetical protein